MFCAEHAEWGRIQSYLSDLGCGRSWDDVYRVKPSRLTCEDCGWPMNARLSPLQVPHFAHQPGAPDDCQAGGESPDHLYLKWCLLTSAQEAGADAAEEVEGPDGAWRADVLASDPGGRWRIALEAQLSKITPDDIRGRSDRMLGDGVPSVWFCYRRAPWLGVVPSVRVGEVAKTAVVVEGLARFDDGQWVKADRMTLTEFLRRVFDRQMVAYSPERRTEGLVLDVLWVDERCLRAEADYQETVESARARAEAERRREEEDLRLLDSRQRQEDCLLESRLYEEEEAAGPSWRLTDAEERRLRLQQITRRMVRRVLAVVERKHRAAGMPLPHLGEAGEDTAGWASDALQTRGFHADYVGRTLGDDRYAGGVPLMGEAAHPVAVIDPDPARAGSRVLAACVLVFTTWELRTRFLAQAPPPPWDVADQYVTLTLDFNPSAPAEVTVPVSTPLHVSIPQQPTDSTRTAAPCICPTPRPHAVFPEGPEAVEPCEETTPASAFLIARCELCGGRYDGPWRRIPASPAGW
ncbi:competence protein CoiA family protein [Streptomyces sp. NPDC051578]|uniref:competence protein CoiA family protein n=1 Tax=Streptomyces sp. NPDC051578 TaxID=3365662 RepID=UPI0037B31A0A